MAWLALAQLGLHSDESALELFDKSANECIDYLEAGPLGMAGRRGEFSAYYACGATIALATHGLMTGQGGDLFLFWKDLIEQGQSNGGSYGSSDYYRLTDAVEDGFLSSSRP